MAASFTSAADARVLDFLGRAERGETRFSNVTGYDAVIDQGRRKRPSGVNRSEDQIGRASCREECRSRWSPYH